MVYLFVYRLTADTGLAPCAENGLLSLAVCKGGQKRGDKIVHTGLRYRIGSGSCGADYKTDKVYILGTYKNDLLYIARVTNVLPMTEYFSGISNGRTDNIYSVRDGKLTRNNQLRKEGIHTEADRIEKDIAGEYVLLSNEFVYLGRDAVHVDILDKYNPRAQELKTYTGDVAENIIEECLKAEDGNNHIPHEPFARGGCR